MQILRGIFVICLLNFTASVSCQLNIPSPDEFLARLFNVTSDVKAVAKNFYFTSVKDENIKFFLYDKNGTFNSLKNDSKMAPLDTKVIVHGWFSKGDEDFVKDMAKAYKAIGKYHVIGVDWSRYSRKNYVEAASASRDIGRVIGEYLVKIFKNDSAALRKVHLIGHSLGAQIAGFAGKHVLAKTGYKVGRISALDAAAPLFEFPLKMPSDFRLSPSDADFVDSYHSNIGFLGFLAPFATADFYINGGGPLQYGCFNFDVFESMACSHGRSVDVFLESIKRKDMRGTSCPIVTLFAAGLCSLNHKEIVGEHVSKNAAGSYFVEVGNRRNLI